MRCVLVGNYGVGNLGDETLKEYFLRAFPSIHWSVLSACPSQQEYPRLPLGVRSIFSPWWRTLHAYFRCDAVVFGGGSLFTDAESPFACMLWWWHAALARLLGKPVLLAFQGIGPLRTRIGRWFVCSVVRHSSFLSVRDETSRQRVEEWYSNMKIVQSFDPVFSLFDASTSLLRIKKVFILIPRLNSSASFVKHSVELVGSAQWDEVRILSLQPEAASEQRACDDLVRAVGGTVIPIRSLNNLTREVAGASFVLAQRYHGALAALALGTDFAVVPQREGDKLEALLQWKGKESMCRQLVREGEEALRTALGGTRN